MYNISFVAKARLKQLLTAALLVMFLLGSAPMQLRADEPVTETPAETPTEVPVVEEEVPVTETPAEVPVEDETPVQPTEEEPMPTEEISTPVEDPVVEPMMAPAAYAVPEEEMPVEKVTVSDLLEECISDENLVQNGGFEAPELPSDGYGWDVIDTGATGLAWVVEWVTATLGAPTPRLELQHGSMAHTPYEGVQYAELDSNWNNAPGGPYSGEDARVRISQTVATVPGNTYRVVGAFSALPGTDEDNNILAVLLDGDLVAAIDQDGTAATDTDWNAFAYDFVAATNSAVVAFADMGDVDTFGTLLDDVRVVECERAVVVDPETFMLSGYKWSDLDSDGVWDEEEPAVADWTITATEGESEPMVTTTDETGFYSFTVKSGYWTVREEQQTGWTQTAALRNGEQGEGMSCYFSVATDDREELYAKMKLESQYRCDFGNHQTEVIEEDEEDEDTERRTGTRVRRPAGQVLGASTMCELYLTEYMQQNTENSPYQVLKLQVFLTLQGFYTPITTVFDATTAENVKKFQAKYASEVITPWVEKSIVPHSQPTGFVYKTTRWKINDIMCPGIEAFPSLDGENLSSNVLIHR